MIECNPVTLARSCGACIKARRKCCRTLPQCQRCTAKHLVCSYKNQPASSSGNFPSLGDARTLGDFFSSSKPQIASKSPRRRRLTNQTRSSFDFSAPLSLDHKVLEDPKVILPMDFQTVTWLKSQLLQLPKSYLLTGGTVCIHPHLYHGSPPASLEAIFSLSALALDPSSSHNFIHAAITSVTSVILSSIHTSHTFVSYLAAIQSFILLQILTLLSPPNVIPPHLRHAAEARNPLLRNMIKTLYNYTPTTLPSAMPPYQAWIIGESLRRTLHIAHMVLGIQSVMRSGTFTLTLFVEALPLDRRAALFDVQGNPAMGLEWDPTMNADLISYRELTDAWDRGEVGEPTLFEKMLLVACKGIDNIELT